MFVPLTSTLLLISLATMTSAMEGTSMYDEWSYTWYDDEPFKLTCNSSWVNAQSGDNVVWMTPSGNTLQAGLSNDDYEITNGNGVTNFHLLIKAVRMEFHGVYKCEVQRGSGASMNTSSTILGLNVHEKRYRALFDKYRHNLIVAVIATAVFVVPLATSCFVWQFQYRSDEEKMARKHRRQQAATGHQYSANGGGDVPMKSTEKRGLDGVENPNFSTQL